MAEGVEGVGMTAQAYMERHGKMERGKSESSFEQKLVDSDFDF